MSSLSEVIRCSRLRLVVAVQSYILSKLHQFGKKKSVIEICFIQIWKWLKFQEVVSKYRQQQCLILTGDTTSCLPLEHLRDLLGFYSSCITESPVCLTLTHSHIILDMHGQWSQWLFGREVLGFAQLSISVTHTEKDSRGWQGGGGDFRHKAINTERQILKSAESFAKIFWY